jgi:hypothetical protein
MDNITRMRENVTKLGELEEQLNMLGDENDPGQMEEMIGDDGKPIRFKPVKTKMCKKLLEKGKCNGIKDKSCKFAHNPIELTGLISVGAQMKNLQGVIKTQNKKLKNNQVMESWIPAGKVDPLSHSKCLSSGNKCSSGGAHAQVQRQGQEGRRRERGQAEEHLRAREHLPQALRGKRLNPLSQHTAFVSDNKQTRTNGD